MAANNVKRGPDMLRVESSGAVLEYTALIASVVAFPQCSRNATPEIFRQRQILFP